MNAFYAGLALVIIGTGFFKSNVSTMVGQIYPKGDVRRDAGFTIFYIGINVGAALGTFICGWLAQQPGFGWHYGFAAAGVGMVLGLIVYVWGRNTYLPGIGVSTAPQTPEVTSSLAGAVSEGVANTVSHAAIGAVVGGALAWLAGGLSMLGILMGLVIGAALGISLLGSSGEERKRVIALIIVVFFVIFFWACYEQVGSSMNLFADRHTDLMVGGYKVPSSWFQSVNPVAIVLFGGVFAALWQALGRRNREPSTALKMVMGLALLGLGFVFMAIGGGRADAGVLVSPFWLVAAYLLHTWGELCLSPVGLSYVTKVAPARFASLLMGVWFLANAAANKIAGAMAAFTPTPGEAPPAVHGGLGGVIQQASTTNRGFFMIFVIASLGAAALMLLFVPLLKRLTASVKA